MGAPPRRCRRFTAQSLVCGQLTWNHRQASPELPRKRCLRDANALPVPSDLQRYVARFSWRYVAITFVILPVRGDRLRDRTLIADERALQFPAAVALAT